LEAIKDDKLGIFRFQICSIIRSNSIKFLSRENSELAIPT